MLRFQSQSQVSALPDEAIDNSWEVLMPSISLTDPIGQNSSGSNGILSSIWNGVGNFLSSYTPVVEEITFGVTSFKTNTRRIRTMWCNVPEDINNYDEAMITFFCSAGMLTQYYLSAWRQLVYNAEGEYFYPMSMYKKNIEVWLYGPGNIGIGGAATMHFTLQGCFPYKQQVFKLQYKDDPQRLRITANFKVDKVVYEVSAAKKAIAEELITSPTGLVDKALSTLSSYVDGSTYSVENTYGFNS